MALTFFIVRISFADAMAAGDGGFGCCAEAGSAVSARPSPAASSRVDRYFIGFSSIAALRPFKNANSLRTRQDRKACKTDEQPVLDDARDRGQQTGQAGSIGDHSQMCIDNPVAAIGDESMAVMPVSDHHPPGGAT